MVSVLCQLIEVQENWLDNPDTRGNVALANQRKEWKEFIRVIHTHKQW